MKRLLIVLLMVLSISSFALAEPLIDLSELSYEDLVALMLEVDAEIMQRPETKEATIPQGTYTIGVHIPAGEYSVSTKDIAIMIMVYKSEDTSSIMNLAESYSISEDQQIGRIILKDGQALTISLGNAIFKTFTGFGF